MEEYEGVRVALSRLYSRNYKRMGFEKITIRKTAHFAKVIKQENQKSTLKRVPLCFSYK
jgi:hypothetical protein